MELHFSTSVYSEFAERFISPRQCTLEVKACLYHLLLLLIQQRHTSVDILQHVIRQHAKSVNDFDAEIDEMIALWHHNIG